MLYVYFYFPKQALNIQVLHPRQLMADTASLKIPDPKKISVGARYLYILAANEAAGSRDFQFPALKMKALGIKERTARKYIKELVDAGFIELVRSGRNTRTPNDHRFSFHWLETP